MDTFLARQPIFDSNRNIYGYELLFRAGEANIFPQIDGDVATSKILSSTFFTVGIEEITGDRRAFVNFTSELLLQRAAHMFHPGTFVVEILEDVCPGTEVIEACRELRSKGYDIALDDFTCTCQSEILMEFATIVKIDFRATAITEIQDILSRFTLHPCAFLAEKIETHEEFDQAKELGFRFFQGFFFARPEMMTQKDISPIKQHILQLLIRVFQEDCTVTDLEKIISRDVSMSYKLLKYINSAHFARVTPLSSVRQGIAFLGMNEIRAFVTIIATSKLCQDKPNELLRSSVIRARFLEHIAAEVGRDKEELFMLGLFSLIDAMLNISMDELIPRLRLNERLQNALVKREGELLTYLQMVELYETGQWERLDVLVKGAGIAEGRMAIFYLEAVTWNDRFA
ncbi:MAG: HDOD domain-containing protein [Proteobacteria bacterium]|jgi:EAL and modified HD-GYP domain-containing signal transduction protein|nr:HDOD domain-containing protein [Desulfocapsa sp.]MBU3946150.1 HDOD domain-containing protein [Pseudomonadota bacterium]MCG2742385.1 HDOD domain-containing protein [Desulfobacteraceae bacterium]MBU4027353.1 HDOD domain-containing protein [Pseudomonadota bacterium]MBU4043120.1 HDOD domain-containing protein [Pseudomonadota bacterium]